MWDGIELREVRVFLTLAEELHFGRTAERLGVTTSRVSQSLRELEAKLGGQLVHRTRRSVSLTSLGERFRDRAAPPYAQLTGVFEQTRTANLELAGVTRVGLLTAPSAGPRLIAICRAFERRHRDCRVEVEELPIKDPFEALRCGEVDLLATWLPHGQPDLVDGPTLAREPRVLAVALDHPLAQRDQVSIEDLADYRVVAMESFLPNEIAEVLIPRRTPNGRAIKRHRLPQGERAHPDRSRANTELSYLVARGEVVHPTVLGVAAYWGHPDTAYIPFRDMPPLRSALVWPRRHASRRARAFVEVAREVLKRSADRAPPAIEPATDSSRRGS